MPKLVCDRCGETYTDQESIESAKLWAENWKALLAKDGETPRGLSPCPNLRCEGELVLKE